jgi:DNA-binding response OmpR family regulator
VDKSSPEALAGGSDYEEELISPTSAFRKDPWVDDRHGAELTQTPRALIVEDEVRLASLLVENLTSLPLNVQVDHHGATGLATALAGSFDVIILDIVLPGLDGFAICRELRKRMVTTPILMLSARGVIEDRVRGLDSGADDYLTKPFEFAELNARVRALLRRRQPAAVLTVTVGDLVLDPVARTVHRGTRRIDLTQKEFELLEYLMRNADQVLTRAMIGEKVWNFTWDRMTNIIDVFINHLRRKLEDAGEPRMIHAVRGVGYVLRLAEGADDRHT